MNSAHTPCSTPTDGALFGKSPTYPPSASTPPATPATPNASSKGLTLAPNPPESNLEAPELMERLHELIVLGDSATRRGPLPNGATDPVDFSEVQERLRRIRLDSQGVQLDAPQRGMCNGDVPHISPKPGVPLPGRRSSDSRARPPQASDPIKEQSVTVEHLNSTTSSTLSSSTVDDASNSLLTEVAAVFGDSSPLEAVSPESRVQHESCLSPGTDSKTSRDSRVSVDSSDSSDVLEESDEFGIQYEVYRSEEQMPAIMELMGRFLSEPYSIYTYRYFIHNWPKLCFLARDEDGSFVGAIVCKLDSHKQYSRRGYIAMLAVDPEVRLKGIGTKLVKKAIHAMNQNDCDEVALETEIDNKGALRLYENLGFVRDKRLFKYYLNGVDAFRLKLWLR